MLMRPDNGGVDQDVFEVRLIRHSGEQAVPYPGLGPSREANEVAVPIAKNLRQIAPGCACPGKPQHRFHKKAIVGAAAPAITYLAWQLWRHPLPNVIFQHETNRHPSLSKKELESDFSLRRYPKCQRPLSRLRKFSEKRRGSLHERNNG